MNYMPVPFKIEGEEFEKYEFSLDSNDTVQLPLELDVSNEIHDITIIAFPEPYREIDSAETALHLQDLIYLRFQTMNSEPETKAENMQPLTSQEESISEPIFLSGDSEKLSIIGKGKNINSAYPHSTNQSDGPVDYKVVALKDYSIMDL